MNANDYKYEVFWSDSDHEFVARSESFPLMSNLDKDPAKALQGIMELIQFVLDEGMAEENGKGTRNS